MNIEKRQELAGILENVAHQLKEPESPSPSEAVERDAARYRWLREERFFEWRDQDVLRCGIRFANAVGPWEPDRFSGSQEKMDAAIDAAMRSHVSNSEGGK